MPTKIMIKKSTIDEIRAIREADEKEAREAKEDIHAWFELTYSQYLTIPRSVLQSTPLEWQQKFVSLLNELDDTIDWRPSEGRYWVALKDKNGRYVHDNLMDYERGRRRIKTKENNL